MPLIRFPNPARPVFDRRPMYVATGPATQPWLHTWSQTLAAHVHLHLLVTAGGLTVDPEDNTRFEATGYMQATGVQVWTWREAC